MYHESYGKLAAARELYRLLPSRAKAFERGDLAAAAAACPQGIAITRSMVEVRALLEA